ncbi:hypothetical protein KC19_2G150300 [Ceratodon purpureus]|uniref:Ammonium transporter n=1 Tax=Ceratodon purpureus TaxID=3225 RepID=A0A8T0IX30_CERPU|nr:hypothetical protein KC19_2G150300 [Ceratodon purpureus]
MAAVPPSIPGSVSSAYLNDGYGATPEWLNKGDNAWQLAAAALVGIQSMPGLVILYGSIVKKKWAVNSAFMALYAFAATWLCWVMWGYKMSFGEQLVPIWGKAGSSLGYKFLLSRATFPSTVHYHSDGSVEMEAMTANFGMADLVLFQFFFAALTIIMLAGAVLGRMSFRAWMLFVPLWLTFSYTVGAFSMWGGGFLWQWGVIDYAGGYVIHVSSGVAGFVAAYWVGPRLAKDRERFPPNNMLLVLTGSGLLWLGWSGFNGGAAFSAHVISALAVLNTHVCAATSLLTWTTMDVFFFGKPSVIGAVQGMMTGLVVITPAAGLVPGWAALIMGIVAGSVPWWTMMVLHKRWWLLQKVDDTLGVIHTHGVGGILGGIGVGLFADPTLCAYMKVASTNTNGAFYGGNGGIQLMKQLVGALFIIAWNVVLTTLILFFIGLITPLRMSEEHLLVGDDAEHGEEAYALWGDGEKFDISRHPQTIAAEFELRGAANYADRAVTLHI